MDNLVLHPHPVRSSHNNIHRTFSLYVFCNAHLVATILQVDEEEEVGEKSGLEEYGVSTRGTRRGGTTRRGTTRRGLSRYRETQRKPRSTIRSSKRGGAQRLDEDIQLTEVQASIEK